MAKRSVTPIDQDWVFKQASSTATAKVPDFLPVAQFPTNVHLDLIANDVIPDPFMGKNELSVQWIGEEVWTYKTTFKSPAVRGSEKAVLAFHGLDTYATVLLNGTQILKTESMFISERVDVTKQLKSDGQNELEITFESAFLKGWEEIERQPDHKWGVWNGDISRLAVRKAQYHWGWDWGPTLLTCGPWRPINIEVYESRICDLWYESTIAEDLKSAEVVVKADVEGGAEKIRFEVSLDGKAVASETVNVDDGHASATFSIEQPELWYPKGYGKQPLYTLNAVLLNSDVEVDVSSKKVGLRRAELIQRPVKDQSGSSFFFQINGVPIFCGGSNWIPADNFIPRITPEKYYDWVKLAASGNQVMLRVWAGGIYEEQAFYNACDEIGILVWQDFLFGCGNYPAHPSILSLIKREAEDNIKLLRHHPSIVIWAGNNEDYQYQESEKLTYDFANKDAESWLKTDFPARYIYEKVLADACKELIPSTFYHFGSPWGGGLDTHDGTVGDIHQWNVWHGTQEKYQNFDKLLGRFISEFGMEAFPSIKTIDGFLPLGADDPDRYAQSSTIDFHNKADGHERRIALYLVENIRYATDDLEAFIYATQLMQAECISTAYRFAKRQWRGPGREYCAGALVWQVDDCWPVTSWSIVDYYLRPKHAFFVLKRELEHLTVGIARTAREELPASNDAGTATNPHSRVGFKREVNIDIWACNLGLEDRTVDVVVKAWDIRTGRETHSSTVRSATLLLKNQSTELAVLSVPVKHRDVGEEDSVVVAAYLVDAKSGEQSARFVNWPEPLKYVHFSQPEQLKAVVSETDGGRAVVEISAEVPVKGVALECVDDGVVFEDNLVDVVPGEVVRVGIKGWKKGLEISTRYLGML